MRGAPDLIRGLLQAAEAPARGPGRGAIPVLRSAIGGPREGLQAAFFTPNIRSAKPG